MSTTPRYHVHMIWTRNIEGEAGFGRLKMAQAIAAGLRDGYDVSSGRLLSILDRRSLAALVRAGVAFLRALLEWRPLPMQCLLYADPKAVAQAVAAIPAGTTAVYLDGVRCVAVLRRLRAQRPDIAIVTDLDDLMSRRMVLTLSLGEPPSLGYLSNAMPGLVARLIGSPVVARAMLRYEGRTLAGIERLVARLSDRSVLISSCDADVLGARIGSSRGIVGIGPPAPRLCPPQPFADARALRFVFVGSDALRQNQLTIDWLVSLWTEHALDTPLVIHGRQTRAIAAPPAVTFAGFARTIDEIYDGRSILLSPSFLAGGVKTKVIEAFGYGAPVVGNAITFEGMDIGDYPLCLADQAIAPIARDPERHRALFAAAARSGAAIARTRHDPAQFDQRWRDVVGAAIAGCANRTGELRSA